LELRNLSNRQARLENQRVSLFLKTSRTSILKSLLLLKKLPWQDKVSKEASGDLVKVLSSRAYSFPGPFYPTPMFTEHWSAMAAAKIREGAAAFEKFVQELQKPASLPSWAT
jgi:hypothetical protein